MLLPLPEMPSLFSLSGKLICIIGTSFILLKSQPKHHLWNALPSSCLPLAERVHTFPAGLLQPLVDAATLIITPYSSRGFLDLRVPLGGDYGLFFSVSPAPRTVTDT